jgi:hypothetical protein
MMRPCRFPTITVVLGVTAYLQVALFIVSVGEASTHAHAGSNGIEQWTTTNTPLTLTPPDIHSIAERERNFVDDDDYSYASSFSDDESERTSDDSTVSDVGETYIRVQVGIVEMNHSRVTSMVIAADSIELLRSHSNIE